MKIPKIPRGWRRLRIGSKTSSYDKYSALGSDHWSWILGDNQMPVQDDEIVIRRIAKKKTK